MSKSARPNLFSYASKELSQDAFICWLIEWSENSSDPELKKLGCCFVEALINKHREVDLESIDSAEVSKQDNRIDVLACINNKYVLLIEDKTYSAKKDGDQLNIYMNAVIDGKTKFKEYKELFAIFLKTGNQSLYSKQEIEKNYCYKVFDRDDFLKVLEEYRGNNAIVFDFREHLKTMNEECQSWKEKAKTDIWSWGAWQGLYIELERQLGGDRSKLPWWGWDYVSNRGGGFLGFWWYPHGLPSECPVYLQLESIPNSKNTRLCFKFDAYKVEEPRREKKWEWNERIVGQSEFAVKPKRMGSGGTVTVAMHDGWLRFDDRGKFDLDKTVAVLRNAEKILLQAADRTKDGD